MRARSVNVSVRVRAREPLPGRDPLFPYRSRPMRPLVSSQVSDVWAEPGGTVGGTGRNAVISSGTSWAEPGATSGATTEGNHGDDDEE
jgi:hypothetical protein